MKKNFIRKVCAVMAIVTSMGAVTGCNRKLEVKYDCTASDYITLGDYKGIKVKFDEDAFVKNLIDQRVQSDLDSLTTYNEVTRVSQDEDQITVSFTGSVSGQAVSGFTSEEYSLILGKDDFAIDGFVDALYGLKAGDTKVVTLVVPDDLANHLTSPGHRTFFSPALSLSTHGINSS